VSSCCCESDLWNTLLIVRKPHKTLCIPVDIVFNLSTCSCDYWYLMFGTNVLPLSQPDLPREALWISTFTHFLYLSLHWLKRNSSGRTMALGSTQPLIETNTRNISWGVKAAGIEGWRTYHFHVPIFWKYGCFNLLGTSGPLHTSRGMALPFICL
jgi:hypothetical protein